MIDPMDELIEVPTRDIKIVCHRGANEYAPENTYASAQYCIDWGMDYLELDVNTSRDGVMYVFHGPALERTTNGSGKLYEFDSAEIDSLECGSWFGAEFSDQRVPRLDEFLVWVDHRIKIFFDVKWANLTTLIGLVYRYNLQDECFFWFGKEKFAREFRALDRSLQLKINVNNAAQVREICKVYGANIVEFSLNQMSASMRDECRLGGVKSMILQRELDLDAFTRILDSGVDMVNVDHGDRFLASYLSWQKSGGSADIP